MHVYDDEEFHADSRRDKQGGNDEPFWKALGVDLLQAGALAAIGVLVGELIRRIDPRRSRANDHYGGY